MLFEDFILAQQHIGIGMEKVDFTDPWLGFWPEGVGKWTGIHRNKVLMGKSLR